MFRLFCFPLSARGQLLDLCWLAILLVPDFFALPVPNDGILPWEQLYELVKQCYYEGERGNKPYDLELMLRIHLIQNLYDLSDEGTRNEIIDSRAFSDFCEVESSNQKARRKRVIRTHTPSRKELRGTLATKHI